MRLDDMINKFVVDPELQSLLSKMTVKEFKALLKYLTQDGLFHMKLGGSYEDGFRRANLAIDKMLVRIEEISKELV